MLKGLRAMVAKGSDSGPKPTGPSVAVEHLKEFKDIESKLGRYLVDID